MAFGALKVGGWAFGEILTSSQMNTLNDDHPNAIDGLNGGTYELQNDLTIGGTAGNNLIFDTDGVTITGDLSVSGILTASDDITLGNGASDSLTVNAEATFQRTLTVEGNTTLGNSAASDTVTLTSVLGYGTNGRITQTAISLPDANGSHDVSEFRNLTAHSPTVTTTRTYTLTATGATNGDWFIFQNLSGNTQNLAGLITLAVANNTGLKAIRVSGTWTVMQIWTS